MFKKNVLKIIKEARNDGRTYLNLSNEKLKSLPEEIGGLTNLTELDLSNNLLTSLPESIGKLNNLTKLDLSNNQLTSLPESIGKLTNLTELYLYDNQLTSLPESIGKLTNLTELWLRNNKLNSLPKSIGKLTNLSALSLSDNQLSSLPESIGKLTNLTKLFLYNNQLTSLLESIGKLTNLTGLYLSNNQLNSLPESIIKLEKLKDFYVDNNPLDSLPPEVVAGGNDAILKYYRELAKAESKRYEGKLMLVGQGKVGKTCLSRAFRRLPFTEQDTTHGIEVEKLVLKHPKKSKQNMTINIWDFGGQVILHSTHQFFLTQRSLYLLVFNARLGVDVGKLNYWLDTIKARTPEALVMLAATESEERLPRFDYEQLRERYQPLLIEDDYHRVDSKSGKNIDALTEAIRKHAGKLELMGHKWPKAWSDIEKEIERRKDNKETHITRGELYEIMAKSGIGQKPDQDSLARILGDLGKITHFPDSFHLREIIILNPQWLTEAISKALEYEPLDKANGELNHAWLADIWSKYNSGLHSMFHRCMEEFEICYLLERSRRCSLVPLCFSPVKPSIKWSNKSDQISRRMIYRFQFIPAGVMARFIVKTNRMTTGTYWQDGVFLCKGEAEALCEHDVNRREITIEVRSPYPQNMLEKLSEYLEAILDEYEGLKPEKKLSCIGDPPTIVNCKGEFPYEELQDAVHHDIKEVRCYKSGHNVKTLEMIYGLTGFRDHNEMLKSIEQDVRGTRISVNKIEIIIKKTIEMFQHQQHVLLDWMWKLDTEIFKLCPTLVSILPIGRRRFNPDTWFNEEYHLRLYCQADQGIHPVGKTYEFKTNRNWWVKTAPYFSHLLNVVKFVSGPAGHLLGDYLPRGDWKPVEAEFKAMEKLLSKIDIPALDKKEFLDGEHQIYHELQGTALRAIYELLKEKDPLDSWKDTLTRYRMPNGKDIWLCEKHLKEYERPEPKYD